MQGCQPEPADLFDATRMTVPQHDDQQRHQRQGRQKADQRRTQSSL